MDIRMFAFKVFFLCILTLPSVNATAQSFYEDEDGYKSWSSDPIKWKDFQVRYIPENQLPVSHISAGISHYTYMEKEGNLEFPVTYFTTYMDKIKSWYDPIRTNDVILRYEQTKFNILEVFSRRMQNAFATYPQDRKRLYDYYDRLLSSTLESFDMESNYGTESDVVERYEQQYINELDTVIIVPIKAPDLNLADWSFGLLIGLNHSRFGAPISDGISHSSGISICFEYMYKKMNLFIWGAFNKADTLKADNFYHDETSGFSWRIGDRTGVMISSFNVGYKLFDRPYFSVTPFIGYGCHYIYNQPTFKSYFNSDLNRPDEITCGGLQGGLIVDWKIRRSYSISSYDESKLRLQIFTSRSQYDKLDVTAGSLNISVSYCFEFWGMSNMKK